MSDAAAAALELEGAGAGAIRTSPLRRARRTAEIIARTLGLRPLVMAELTDVDVGHWQGRTYDELAAAEPDRFESYFRFPMAASFPGGGSIADASRRLASAVLELATAIGSPIVAVTHELPIRGVLVRLRSLEGTAMWDPAIAPGSITIVRATKLGLELPTPLEDLFRRAQERRAGSGVSATRGTEPSVDR